MDSLLKVVRKSPKPFGRTTPSKSSKHKKLGENWGEDNQQVKEGVTFYLKYLGSTLVEELDEEGSSYGDNISAEAVKTIVNMAKMSGKKLQKVAVTVSMYGIKVYNMANKEVKTDLPIYRISFCTADKFHDKVFAYIARNLENETMECHAFLCSKRKIAQAVTLTVARSFKAAQAEWEQDEQATTEKHDSESEKREESSEGSAGESPTSSMNTHNLLLFDADNRFEDNFICNTTSSPAANNAFKDFSKTSLCNKTSVGFEDDFNVEDDFSSLAKSRSGKKRPSPFSKFSMGLDVEDLEEGVQQLMSGQNPCELTRHPSTDDLMLL